jgi:type IX secretion system PorP/SprF family membrane protein
MRRLFNVLIVLLAIIGCCLSKVNAQNYPVYGNYYLNPYLYNPAEAATENTYLFLDYKRQWLGFEGAPALGTASFNTLLDHKRAGIGAKLSNYKRGILSTTDISLSYCYGLLLNKQKSTFFFGMSAGSITASVDKSKVSTGDLTDVVLQNFGQNNIQPTANFGMLLRTSKGLNFGLVIPQLFAPDFDQQSNYGATRVSPTDNIILSFYYKKIVDGKLVNRKKRGIRAKVKTADAAAPIELYTLYKYSAYGTSQAEATVKINFSPNLWLAGGYRQSYGFTAGGGIAVKNFLVNYMFEPGNQPQPGFSTGTHQVTVGIKLGEPKIFKRVTPLLRSTLKVAPSEQHLARFQQSVEDPANIEQPENNDTKKKFYVVLKGFADFNTADAYKKKILEQKYNADIFYYEKEKKFYVFVFQSGKASEASEEARNLKNYTKLKDARVLTVEESK